MLAVKETEIACAKLYEKYFTTKTGQATAAWKQAKAMWTSTNRSYAVLIVMFA